jgi:hypothetical protein
VPLPKIKKQGEIQKIPELLQDLPTDFILVVDQKGVRQVICENMLQAPRAPTRPKLNGIVKRFYFPGTGIAELVYPK